MQTRPSQLRCIVRTGAVLLQLLVWAKRNADYVETQSRVVHETGNAGSIHFCIFAKMTLQLADNLCKSTWLFITMGPVGVSVRWLVVMHKLKSVTPLMG